MTPAATAQTVDCTDVRLARIEQLLESLAARMDERRGQYLEKIEDAKLACARQDVRVTELEKGLALNDAATEHVGDRVEALDGRIRELEQTVTAMGYKLVKVSVITGFGTAALTAAVTAAVMKLLGG